MKGLLPGLSNLLPGAIGHARTAAPPSATLDNNAKRDGNHARHVGGGTMGCCAGGPETGVGTGGHMMGGPMMSGGMMGWRGAEGYYSNLNPEQLRRRQYMMDRYVAMQQQMMNHMMRHQHWMSQLPPAKR